MGRAKRNSTGNSTGQQQDKLTVAQILKTAAGQYVERCPQQAAPQVQSTLAKLSLCRTAALGERHYQCSKCGVEAFVYHSCGDRHCPTCSGAKRADWLDSASQLILPGVPYFQVVFTLPGDLSRLALGNRRVIYNLLFRSAWAALQATIRSEHGYDPAALLVLHTWNQKLDAHAHVHAVVPGGGPGPDGSGWRWSQRQGNLGSVGEYLVDVTALRCSYRDHFLRGLERLHASGKLKLTGKFASLQEPSGWQLLIDGLKSCDWVSHIQPPPTTDCSVDNVLKYLARYLSGGPISDTRIVSTSNNLVTFMAREGTQSGGTAKQVPVTMSMVEFTRCWALHILPKGYTKTRRFGGWSNTRCAEYHQRCAQALADIDILYASACDRDTGHTEESNDSDARTLASWYTACSCGAPLILQGDLHQPSWRVVMNSSDRPSWYRRL